MSPLGVPLIGTPTCLRSSGAVQYSSTAQPDKNNRAAQISSRVSNLLHAEMNMNIHIFKVIPSYLGFSSGIIIFLLPVLNSHRPKPESFICSRLSTRHVLGFRFPWNLRLLLWMNSIPWNTNEHVKTEEVKTSALHYYFNLCLIK